MSSYAEMLLCTARAAALVRTLKRERIEKKGLQAPGSILI